MICQGLSEHERTIGVGFPRLSSTVELLVSQQDGHVSLHASAPSVSGVYPERSRGASSAVRASDFDSPPKAAVPLLTVAQL